MVKVNYQEIMGLPMEGETAKRAIGCIACPLSQQAEGAVWR